MQAEAGCHQRCPPTHPPPQLGLSRASAALLRNDTAMRRGPTTDLLRRVLGASRSVTSVDVSGT
jgi:hypothetical protein